MLLSGHHLALGAGRGKRHRHTLEESGVAAQVEGNAGDARPRLRGFRKDGESNGIGFGSWSHGQAYERTLLPGHLLLLRIPPAAAAAEECIEGEDLRFGNTSQPQGEQQRAEYLADTRQQLDRHEHGAVSRPRGFICVS